MYTGGITWLVINLYFAIAWNMIFQKHNVASCVVFRQILGRKSTATKKSV